MARTDTYPRAKALVVKAKLDNPDLTGTKALEMLEATAKEELGQIERGEKLADTAIGFPLEVPTSAKTCSRWIADIPKSTRWDGNASNPMEFRVIARVLRELTARGTLNRMLTQAEAANIARFGMIAPATPPLSLFALAQLAIALETNEDGRNALTSWLVFSVEDSSDSGNYPSRDWSDEYNRLSGVAFPEMPDFHVDIHNMNEQLPLLKGIK